MSHLWFGSSLSVNVQAERSNDFPEEEVQSLMELHLTLLQHLFKLHQPVCLSAPRSQGATQHHPSPESKKIKLSPRHSFRMWIIQKTSFSILLRRYLTLSEYCLQCLLHSKNCFKTWRMLLGTLLWTKKYCNGGSHCYRTYKIFRVSQLTDVTHLDWRVLRLLHFNCIGLEMLQSLW